MKILPAAGLVAWFLKRAGFHGITLPWAIYILPIRLHDARLIRHEQEHARQITQYGVIGFYARYFWLTIRHGYWNNPLEVKARRAELET